MENPYPYYLCIQVIIVASVDAFNRFEKRKGYLLLKLIRKYVELDMYLSLGVQTEDTLKFIDATLQDFGTRLEVRYRVYVYFPATPSPFLGVQTYLSKR